MSLRSPASAKLTRAEVDTQLKQLSGADWIRARRLARAKSYGLTGADADDILQEALEKLLSGERVWPSGAQPMVVIGNAMRSIASNWRKRAKTGPIDESIEVTHTDADRGEGSPPQATAVERITPEQIISGGEQLELVEQAVAHDEEASFLVAAWADGLRGESARAELKWPVKTHDAARKRLGRCLDNIGRNGETR